MPLVIMILYARNSPKALAVFEDRVITEWG